MRFFVPVRPAFQFIKKGTFKDNFIESQSNCGVVANFGTMLFNLRGHFLQVWLPHAAAGYLTVRTAESGAT